ncbi:hypothetical protein [Salinarimonas chemoclinalis]|uniref:hypothetical protein n=1 Tax=Salinarimonas chemoclinalis TaxID=3241599 RepID=UPI003555FA96
MRGYDFADAAIATIGLEMGAEIVTSFDVRALERLKRVGFVALPPEQRIARR